MVFPGSICGGNPAVALGQMTGGRPVMVRRRVTKMPDRLGLIAIPGAHRDGNYRAGPEGLDRPKSESRVALHCASEVDGSVRDIAGIVDEAGNVPGTIPHPERMIEPAPGTSDGRRLVEGLPEAVGKDR